MGNEPLFDKSNIILSYRLLQANDRTQVSCNLLRSIFLFGSFTLLISMNIFTSAITMTQNYYSCLPFTMSWHSSPPQTRVRSVVSILQVSILLSIIVRECRFSEEHPSPNCRNLAIIDSTHISPYRHIDILWLFQATQYGLM